MQGPAIVRLLNLVKITETCWLFQGTKVRGYGQFRFKGKTALAHRVMYELLVGEIPNGLDLCHKCDVRNCVNPEHLFPGTRAENMQDAKSKGRLKMPRISWQKSKTHCPKGHKYTPENTYLDNKLGHRKCRTCVLARQAAEKRRKSPMKQAKVKAPKMQKIGAPKADKKKPGPVPHVLSATPHKKPTKWSPIGIGTHSPDGGYATTAPVTKPDSDGSDSDASGSDGSSGK